MAELASVALSTTGIVKLWSYITRRLLGTYRVTHLQRCTLWWVSGHSSLRWIPKISTYIYVHTYINICPYIHMGFTVQSNLVIRYLFFTTPYKFYLTLTIHKEKYTVTCQNHYDFAVSCLSSRQMGFPSWIRSPRWSIVYYNYTAILGFFMSSLYYSNDFYCSNDKKFQSGVGSQCAKAT